MLPGSYRLKKRCDFSRVYDKGYAKACAEFVLYRYNRKGSQTRIGFSTSKKLGHAVIRNRVKRVFRHAVVALLDKFPPGYDYIFVIRKPALGRSVEEIKTLIVNLLRK